MDSVLSNFSALSFLFYKDIYFKDYIATIKHVAKFIHAKKAEMAITMQ